MGPSSRAQVAFIALAFASLPLAPPSALAQSTTRAAASDEERAAASKARGDAAMVGLRYREALDAYREAYEITKNPVLLYNQARAHQALGEYPVALQLLERFDKEAPAEQKARLRHFQELLADLRQHITKLTVRCNVSGARVLLGDRVIGTTPLPAVVETAAGHTKLQVLEDKHQPFEKELELPGGGALTIDVELVRREATAVISILSNVNAPRVSLDTKPVGQSPIELVVSSGPHEYVVDASGYETARGSIVVVAGERRKVDVPLKKAGPITTKWWFWTGIGVVVAGGIATYVVLTTSRSADRGTISPGQVAAPLVTF